MLVLSRRLHEKILLPEFDTAVQVVGINTARVRLGISAPPRVRVLREELHGREDQWTDVTLPINTPLREDRHGLSRQLRAAALSVEKLRQQLPPGRSQDADTTLIELAENIRLLREQLAFDERVPTARQPQLAELETCRR